MLCQNIKRLCRERGISIAELERAVGIGNGVIARWSDGKCGPGVHYVKSVADYFGVAVDELLKEVSE